MSFKSFMGDIGKQAAIAFLNNFIDSMTSEKEQPNEPSYDTNLKHDGAILVLDGKPFVCPECGNMNEHLLCIEDDIINCMICNLDTPVKYETKDIIELS